MMSRKRIFNWLMIVYIIVAGGLTIAIRFANVDMTETRMLIEYWYVFIPLALIGLALSTFWIND